jgi:hypothetical protein
MKNEIKVTRQAWFKGLVLALLLLPGVTGFSAPPMLQPVSCPIQNLTKTDQSTGYVSYSWSQVSGATEYRVWYVRTNDNYTSSVYSTGSTNISFSSLPAGSYRFYFAAVCGQETLDFILDDVLML